MTDIRTKITEIIDEGVERHEFGCADKKGRVLGANVYFAVHVYAPVEEDHCGFFYRTEPGTYFCWKPESTRGGNAFGAYNAFRACKTESERAAAVAKYLKATEARAKKLAA